MADHRPAQASPGSRRRPRPTDALVVGQGLGLVALAWPGRGRWRLPRPVRAAALAGVALGAAASLAGARALGSDLTPFVEPRSGAELRTTGVYGLSRNPVYAGMLVAAASVAVLRRRPEPLVAAAGLSVVLHLKAGVEERRLRDRFGAAFEDYASRTPRLVGRQRHERA